MTHFGLDCFLRDFPAALKGKRVGVVCHAASVTSSYSHIVDVLMQSGNCKLVTVFGPQHGIFGQTQDNMVEWEGGEDKERGIMVHSLYGATRKPTPQMLLGLDALIFDIQDVGARPYTYVWTLKLCMEACQEAGIAVWVLDRPNPIGCLPVDGPMLDTGFFSFVGGAQIPLCHRLTMGEMAVLLRRTYFPFLELHISWMDGWWRNSLWSDTGLPWVLPSPNMPTLDTAVVYPGMVLLEATNISEGRGTTRPFEFFGAPYMNMADFKKKLFSYELGGCTFREHGFIPAFQKWAGTFCNGMQIHVTNPRNYHPVATAFAVIASVCAASNGEFRFKDPPYEYETEKMPFDILSGDTSLREAVIKLTPLQEIKTLWKKSYSEYLDLFGRIAHYPEERI